MLGCLHVIDLDERIGLRRGLIIERRKGITYIIHLILWVISHNRKELDVDYRRTRILDYPVYWLRLSWYLPASVKLPNVHPRFRLAYLLGILDGAMGINAKSEIQGTS
jgi:hypothetical protein